MKCTVSTAIYLLVGVTNILAIENLEAFSAASSSNITLKGQYGPLESPQIGYASTNDCGSTSGTLPSLQRGKGIQLGCAGPFKKQDITLTLTTPGTSFYSDVLVCIGGSDNACTNINDPNLLCKSVSTPVTVPFPSCMSERCCVWIVCNNDLYDCSGAYAISYNSTFAATLRDDVLAGIIVGSIVVACCLYVIVYNCCCKRKKKGDDGSQQPIYAPVQNWGGQQQYQQQQQYHQGPPPGYGGPPPTQGYNGPPTQGYGGPQPRFQSPPQGYYGAQQGGYQGQG